MKKIVIYALTLILFGLALRIVGMPLSGLWDPVSLVVVSTAGLLAWINWADSDWRHFGQSSVSRLQLVRQQRMLRVLWRYLIGTAIFSYVLYSVIVLADHGENMATIGQGLALLLLTGIYLLLLRLLVIQPLLVSIEKRLLQN